MTKAKTSKQISCKVRMLDDQELPFQVDVSTRSMSHSICHLMFDFTSNTINYGKQLYDVFVKTKIPYRSCPCGWYMPFLEDS